MEPTILLFDIDGTLITTGGVGRQALELAFDALYGRANACDGFRLDGMTDGRIVRQGLAAIGVEASREAVDAVLQAYVRQLEALVAAAPDASYRVHPGMHQALDQAERRANVAVGLGTGNIRPGARIKLERVGIYGRFRFGGFGSDHDDRVQLLATGAQRGADQLGAPRQACRVVVIGDTPKDVAAAKGIGAECVGVGTGHFRPAELVAAGADAAFGDLAEDGALDALLGGARA